MLPTPGPLPARASSALRRKRTWRSILALTSASALLAACALPKSEQLPSGVQLRDEQAAMMGREIGTPVERIRVPRDTFKPSRIANPVPPQMRAKAIDVRFSAGGTLGDLVQSLSASDIQIGFQFNEIMETGTGTQLGGGLGRNNRMGGNSGGRNIFGNNSGNSQYGSNSILGNNSGYNSGYSNGYNNSGSLNPTSSSVGGYGNGYGGGYGGGYGSTGLNNDPYSGGVGAANRNGIVGNAVGSTIAGNIANRGLGGARVTDRQDIMLARRLPFTRYSGNLGGLIDALRKGAGIVFSYENGILFVSDREKYAVTLPQNEDVIAAVAEEIRALGGEGIVPSVRGGRIIYSASPLTQENVIGPYLDRLARNMAVITLQTAVVSVSLSDTTSSGFDWARFQVALEGRDSRINPTTNAGGTGTSSAPETGSPLDSAGLKAIDPGAVVDLRQTGLVLGKTTLGNYFGTYGALSVASAINFLSQFGNTKIDQNVQLKTLSGTDVRFRSGQTVPYVTGVAATTVSNSNSVTGSSATDKVDTGLTMMMTPYYDADTQLVTMEVALSLRSILQFVQLSAGNQLGTFTQPLTQDQELTDTVRTPAGRTVVIGGLQIENEQYNGSEPVGLRNIAAKMGGTPDFLSSRAQTIKRDALFVILRPTVTVFVPEGR